MVMSAQNSVNVSIDGLDEGQVKTSIEQILSSLLTEANAAYDSNRSYDFSSLNLDPDVRESISALWDNTPFKSTKNSFLGHCITISNGCYQVRNIPLLLKSVDTSDEQSDTQEQEAVVGFDSNGKLESFNLALPQHQYTKILDSNRSVTDIRRRQLIIDYVEQFRTAYNKKDTAFLNAIFSDDALIVTGKVIRRQTRDGIKLPDRIEYTKQSKLQYLNNLEKAFARNKFIRVTFEDISVMLHPTDENSYGVSLKQGWTSDTYHDDGYLFLYWDFADENNPVIHFRGWQPEEYIRQSGDDKLFSIYDVIDQ